MATLTRGISDLIIVLFVVFSDLFCDKIACLFRVFMIEIKVDVRCYYKILKYKFEIIFVLILFCFNIFDIEDEFMNIRIICKI